MNLKMLLISICLTNSSYAKQLNTVQISPTVSADLPFEISTKVDLFSLNSKFLTIPATSSHESAQILFIHNKPPTFANKFSVEQYWKDSRQQTKSSDKKEKNYGCRRITARTYSSTRDVAQGGNFIAESLYWNIDKDLMLIRVSSANRFTNSRKILTKIKVQQNSRLPAEVTK